MAAVMKPHHPIVRIGLGLLARQAESHQQSQRHRAPDGGKAQEILASLVGSIGHYARLHCGTRFEAQRRNDASVRPSRSTVGFLSSWTPCSCGDLTASPRGAPTLT